MSQLKFPFPKDRADRFDNFAVDEKNAKAVMLCKAFSDGSSGESGSLVIHGPKGCGKTHILAAMGQLATEMDDSVEAMYLDCMMIKENVTKAPNYEELKNWITGFEGASFLTIDNLHELVDSQGAQDQVFHLYNAVVQSGGRIALATSESPNSWKLLDWLSTRLLWGLVANLEPVGDEMRIDVLYKISMDLGMTLPESAAKWLLTRLPRDPASQLEALELIDQRSLTSGRKVSISLIKQALEYSDAR